MLEIEQFGWWTLGMSFSPDGAVHYYDLAVFPVSQGEGTGALIRIDDLTQRLRLEQMAVQTEKMSSLGALASGLAQEINNPLSGIMQNCQTILRLLTPKLDANRQAGAECARGDP